MVMKSLERSKSTRKFDHEITFNKGLSGLHSHKKGKFCIFASVHLKRSQIPMEKKIPKQFFTNLGFFWFSLPKKFSKFPGPGGERRQRGKGGREWQGAG